MVVNKAVGLQIIAFWRSSDENGQLAGKREKVAVEKIFHIGRFFTVPKKNLEGSFFWWMQD